MCLHCVSKLLFNKELEKDELPSSTIVQSIVDKEHFLVKKVHISDEVAATEQWVLNRVQQRESKRLLTHQSLYCPEASLA